jgi:signal transduction histidine kinase
MSHELRRLNGIIGLPNSCTMPPSGQYLQSTGVSGDILVSARHLLQLINDILDLSKMKPERRNSVPRHSTHAVVEEACSIVRPMVESSVWP